MIQKCDGVKILDLEEKLEATGNEYIVTAEKDNNYKLPLESVADIVIGSSWFDVSSGGSLKLNDSITIGNTSDEHAIINSGGFSLKNSTLDNVVITYDNTTSSIVLKNPTGIDSSRIEIKALDDNASDAISVTAYDSQGNKAYISPLGVTVSDGVNTHIDIMKNMITVTNSRGTNIGWTGTKNGLRFIGGICVGGA